MTIKKIPDRLYQRLRQSARKHRRSLNSEVIVSLENALASGRMDPEDFLASVRALCERISGVHVTDKDLNVVKDEGRL
jgi:plasmid stability protein